MVLLFVGGEMLFYLAWKVIRGDFMYWVPVDGSLGVALSFFNRVVVKVIVDFSGCLHLRHPYEMGGFSFSLSMLWAQLMPFVALQMYQKKIDLDIDDTAEINGNVTIANNATSVLPNDNNVGSALNLRRAQSQ